MKNWENIISIQVKQETLRFVKLKNRGATLLVGRGETVKGNGSPSLGDVKTQRMGVDILDILLSKASTFKKLPWDIQRNKQIIKWFFPFNVPCRVLLVATQPLNKNFLLFHCGTVYGLKKIRKPLVSHRNCSPSKKKSCTATAQGRGASISHPPNKRHLSRQRSHHWFETGANKSPVSKRR